MNDVYGTCYINEFFLYEGRKWSVLRVPKDPLSPKYTENILIKGDTLINDRHYQKIYRTGNEDLSDLKYAGAIRGYTDEYYFWSPSSQAEVLLFDFALNASHIGKKIVRGSTTWCITAVKDTVLFDYLTPSKYVTLCEERNGQLIPDHQDIWIKRVGSLLTGIGEIPYADSGYQESHLLCCSVIDTYPPLYENESYGSCFIDDRVSIKNTSVDSSVRVHSSGNGRVTLEWETSRTFESLSIYRQDGVLQRTSPLKSGQNQITESNLAQGIYFYILRTSGGFQTSGKFYVD